MTKNIMKKLRLAFQIPPKPPVRRREPTPRCPHCGKTTRIVTVEDMDKRRKQIMKYKF